MIKPIQILNFHEPSSTSEIKIKIEKDNYSKDIIIKLKYTIL